MNAYFKHPISHTRGLRGPGHQVMDANPPTMPVTALADTREHLAPEPTARDGAAADVQREVFAFSANLRARAVGPTDVDRVQAASCDVGTEVRVPTAFGEVI